MQSVINFFEHHPDPKLSVVITQLLEIWYSQDANLASHRDPELKQRSLQLIQRLESEFNLTLEDVELISACDDDFRRYLAQHRPSTPELLESA